MLLNKTVREPKSVCAPADRAGADSGMGEDLIRRNWFPAGLLNSWREGSEGFVSFNFSERMVRRVDVI
jgi:hypothetical protein